jgi:hypothetical protein
LTDARRTFPVDLFDIPGLPPAELDAMARFVRTHRQAVIDLGAELRGSSAPAVDTDLRDRLVDAFFAAIVGCTRIAHIVMAANDWPPPPSGEELFPTLADLGVVDRFVGDVLAIAEDALDDRASPSGADTLLRACLDPTYTDCIERFLTAVEAGGS